MTPSVVLNPTSVRLEAGTSVKIPLQIRNTGDIVEGYRVEIVGPPSEWITVDPAEVTLFPGDMTTVDVDIHPARTAAPVAGEHLFGVRVVSTEHAEDAVVPEAVVEVLPFTDVTAELIPRTSHGARGGRHEVAVDNRGNAPVTVGVSVSDPADMLITRARPETLTVEPGAAGFADVRVRSSRTLWRGQPVTHPFSVLVAPEAGTAVALEGTHVQMPLIPRWLPRAALAAAAVVIALGAIWYGLLQRTIASSAKEAVQPQVAQVQAQAREAGTAAGVARDAAADADTSAERARTLVQRPPQPRTVELPFGVRLAASPAAGATGTTTVDNFPVAQRDTLQLTDFVFENPQGDFGTLRLAVGSRVLFNLALENFRTSDFHFVTPITVKGGETLTLTVLCAQVGQPPAQPQPSTCAGSAYLSGTVTRLQPRPTPTPSG
jgi:hypothetical protein